MIHLHLLLCISLCISLASIFYMPALLQDLCLTFTASLPNSCASITPNYLTRPHVYSLLLFCTRYIMLILRMRTHNVYWSSECIIFHPLSSSTFAPLIVYKDPALLQEHTCNYDKTSHQDGF